MTKNEEFRGPQITRMWSYRTVDVEEYAGESINAKEYENEAIVGVMGVTGAGKSSFISLLSSENIKIGHDLESSTTETQFFSFFHGSESGYLIDTPGFDDTSQSDTDILKEIATCFCNMYSKGIRLNGIIYLHRITDPRMSGSAIKNLNMFEKLCGTKSLPNVVFVTSMWEELEKQNGGIAAGEKREKELKTNDTFWARMLNDGSMAMRHNGDLTSAQAILSTILEKRTKITLDIQIEMVNQNLPLDRTAAGKYLKQDYAELMQKYEVEADNMQKSKSAAIEDRDREMVAVMDEEILKLTDEMTKAKNADQKLDLDFRDLREERSRLFQEPVRSSTRDSTKSSGETETNPGKINELERSIRSLEEKHKSELELLEEQHRSQASREERILRAEARNVATENDVLKDIVRQLDQERKQLVDLLHRDNKKRAKVRKPDRRPPPPLPPRQQDRGTGPDIAVSAARRALGFAAHVWQF